MSDEYKFAITTPWPIIVHAFLSSIFLQANNNQLPIVWESFLPEAQADFAAKQKKYEKLYCTYEKQLRDWDEHQRLVSSDTQASSQSNWPPPNRKGKKLLYDPKPVAPDLPQPHMQSKEVCMFLSLATALKLYLGCDLTDQTVDCTFTLLHDYLITYCCVSETITCLSNFYLLLHTAIW
jgi:hypothetical protein